MAQHAYVIVKREYDHWEDDAKEETSIQGVYLTVAAANREARRDAREDADAAPDNEGIEESTNAHGGYVAECRTFQDDRDHFEVEVEAFRLEDAPVAKTISVSPEATKTTPFGPMITIPVGKLHGLRRARFAFIGKPRTMTREVAKAAVELYGGFVVDALRLADYVFVGEKATEKEFNNLGLVINIVEQLDEMQFFDLLRSGVPQRMKLKESLETSYDENDSEDEGDEEEEETHAPPAKRQRT